MNKSVAVANLTSIMRLGPRSVTFSAQCGCCMVRYPDDTVEGFACPPHRRGFVAICGALASGRRLTQEEMRHAAFGKS